MKNFISLIDITLGNCKRLVNLPKLVNFLYVFAAWLRFSQAGKSQLRLHEVAKVSFLWFTSNPSLNYLHFLTSYHTNHLENFTTLKFIQRWRLKQKVRFLLYPCSYGCTLQGIPKSKATVILETLISLLGHLPKFSSQKWTYKTRKSNFSKNANELP